MITAIIPARGGSKGIPHKNVLPFCGHPLIAWTISTALRSECVDTVYVSTDDEEIGAVAMKYGAGVIRRPAELATDSSTSESALLHASQELGNRGAEPETVVFLQATSPLREASEIDEAVRHMSQENLDSLFSASEPEDFLLWTEDSAGLRSLNYDFASRKRRQDGPSGQRVLVETGSFYITKTAGLLRHGNRLWGRIGYWPVAFWKSFEIDSLEGVVLCEALMRAHGLDRTPPVEKTHKD
jgi:CMP-N,N'-diacetyllegionaminic acid synthase